MKDRLRTLLFASIPAAAVALVPATSFAQSNPCGNIELTAIGECHFEFSGGCETKCTPLNFQASCDGECNASVDVSCTDTCQASCEADCMVDPPSFDCQGSCEADCTAQAEAGCTDSDCSAYAEAQCKSDCSAHCEATPPSGECSADCEVSCSGSCETNANLDCEVQCTADLQGGCETQCADPQGALFCDGQFIYVEDIPSCLDYLAENFSIDVEFTVDVGGDAEGGCSVGNTGADSGVGAMFGLAAAAGGLAAAGARRRKRQQAR